MKLLGIFLLSLVSAPMALAGLSVPRVVILGEGPATNLAFNELDVRGIEVRVVPAEVKIVKFDSNRNDLRAIEFEAATGELVRVEGDYFITTVEIKAMHRNLFWALGNDDRNAEVAASHAVNDILDEDDAGVERVRVPALKEPFAHIVQRRLEGLRVRLGLRANFKSPYHCADILTEVRRRWNDRSR